MLVAAGSFGGTGGLVATLRTLVWVNRDGSEQVLAAPARPYSYPRVSPDGTRIAVDVRDAESDIWVWSVERATLTRLTFDPLFDRFPVWSPDGRRIAFSSQRDGSRGNTFWQMADGTGQPERLAKGANNSQVFPTSFSPDGTQLLVHGDPGGRQVDDIGIVSLERELSHRAQHQEACLRAAVRARQIVPDDMRGGTFTISNLGMYGVDAFTAIINPPESAILAIGRTTDTPVGRDGRVVLRPMATFTLSSDHRIVDGVTAARFIADLREAIEHPEGLS